MDKKKNLELEALANLDQLDRSRYNAKEISEHELWARDRSRLLKVIEFVEKGMVSSYKDYENAAIVFQHGRNERNERDSFASEMAVKMMQKAIELGSTNKWLLAAAIDRDLMIKNQAQIYGTQYVRKGEGHLWTFYNFDDSIISDEERRAFGVTPIAEQKSELEKMNKKKILGLFADLKDLDKVFDFCQKNKNTKTEYDLSWQGLSRFGFEIKRLKGDEEGLKIFQFLIKLYPEEYDGFHSLGILLAKLEREKEAIEAFEMSLKLKPDFEEAQRDLKNILGKGA